MLHPHGHARRASGLVATAIACCALLLAGCAGQGQSTPTLTAPPTADVQRGFEYRVVGETPLALDACLPSDSSDPAPAVVLVHGGAFMEGDRSTMLDLCTRMAKAGIAAFAVDYRLVPDVYPAQVEDVAAAVDWLRQPEQVEAFHLSDDVSIMGSSAGAIIALSTAAYLSNAGTPVTSVVALSPAADLRADAKALGTPAPDLESVVLGYLGCATTADCTVAEEASPITQAGSLPPTMIVHGSSELIPVEQAQALDAALEQAGVAHELLISEGDRHGLQLLDSETNDAVVRFLLAHAT